MMTLFVKPNSPTTNQFKSFLKKNHERVAAWSASDYGTWTDWGFICCVWCCWCTGGMDSWRDDSRSRAACTRLVQASYEGRTGIVETNGSYIIFLFFLLKWEYTFLFQARSGEIEKEITILWGNEHWWIFSKGWSPFRLAHRNRGRRGYEIWGILCFSRYADHGRNTYEQVLKLSPDGFPYEDKTCYIVSRTLQDSHTGTRIIREDVLSFIHNLKWKRAAYLDSRRRGTASSIIKRKISRWAVSPNRTCHDWKRNPLFPPTEQESRFSLQQVNQYKQIAEMHFVLKEDH